MSWPRPRLPNRKRRALLALVAAPALAAWISARGDGPGALDAETQDSTPADRGAIRALEGRVQAAARKVMPAVVAVEVVGGMPSRDYEPFASGVIISADGLVLTQAHVSHLLPWKPGDPATGQGPSRDRCRRPGERAAVVFSDGRRVRAELLGADLMRDLSLLQLPGPGPYPHLPLDPGASVGVGDWALKLGHPVGYRRGRPPVVRLGRVLARDGDHFVTDCFINGGDSGGPFVDLDGRLVGILHLGNVPGELRDSLRSDWPPRSGPWSGTTSGSIRRSLGGMLAREIIAADGASPLDPGRGDPSGPRETLPRPRWTQGEATAGAFRDVVRGARPSVVAVLDEAGREVALGTAVDAGGWVVTVAGTMPAEPRCRLPDGRVVAARVAGVDPAYDLALLKLPVADLPAVTWAGRPAADAGEILAAVGPSAGPLAIGVVSVPRRDLPGPFPTRVSRPDALPPRISGRPTAEGFLVEGVSEAAVPAGIRRGDVIETIGGRAIRGEPDVLGCVSGRVAGERLPVRLSRGGLRRDVTLPLVAYPGRHADLPTMFEHDMPLSPAQCGGPVVGTGGGVAGITVYRGQYGCFAIPGDRIAGLLPGLKAAKPPDGSWVKPPRADPDGPIPPAIGPP